MGRATRLWRKCKHAVTECYSQVYTNCLEFVASSIQKVLQLSDHFRQDRHPQKPKPSWSAYGEVNYFRKGIKSLMSDLHRSDRNGEPFAAMGCLASVPAWHAKTEWKGLRKDWFGAFMALLCSLATFGVLAGCNSGAPKANSQGTQTPLISVALTQAPPNVITGNSANVAATVTNDPASAGVDWVATCSNQGSCGTFAPSHTASGAPAIYTAPPEVPTKGTVTITALSTTDRSKSSSVTASVTSTVTGIAITTPLPGTVAANAVLTFGATVYGDPANLGVDWTVSCPTPDGFVDCSPSPSHALAGGTVAYTVLQAVQDPVTRQPVSLVGSSITITAYATADHSKYATFGPVSVTAPITVTISQPLPSTMLTGATAQVTAAVANDATKAGVTWSVSCTGASDCGSVTPLQTASGVAATYTAPATVPTPNPAPGLQVIVTAYANATGPVLGSSTQQAATKVDIVAPISVALTKGNAITSMVGGRSAQFAATVSNDYSNAGVDWTVSCGSPGACGTFSAGHTASGATTTYTAPSAIPTGGTVTITATSTADATKNVQSQPITIQAPGDPKLLLKGAFVLYLRANNSQNGPFILGGVINGDGNGNITNGQVDVADSVGDWGSVSLASNTYSIGPDGRGTITLALPILNNNNNPTPSFGVPVPGSNLSTLTLSVVFATVQLDPATGNVLHEHALLTETDVFGDATGTLDLQDTAALQSLGLNAVLNGAYSLQLSGTQSGFLPFFLEAGITSQPSTLDGPSYCTFASYTADQSVNGAFTSASSTTGSQSWYCPPGPSGRFTLSSVNLGLPNSFSLDVWSIDTSHFVVMDFLNAPTFLGGYLTMQPASPALSGTLAFTEAGATTAPSALTSGQPQLAGGFLICGSSNGSIDVVLLGSSTPLIGQPINTTCGSPGSNGRSLITITGAGNSGISQLAAYPTTDGSFYLLELDGGSAGTSGPSGAGVAYMQSVAPPISAANLSGTYAAQFSATLPVPSGAPSGTQPGSQAFTGWMTFVDGTSPLITGGAVDVNSFATSPAPGTGSPSTGASLTGSYNFTAGSAGTFPLTFTIAPAAGNPAPPVATLDTACYLFNANTCLLLGRDPSAPGTGILLLQNTGL